MSPEVKNIDTKEIYSQIFKDNSSEIFRGSSDFVNSIREKAIERFESIGLPQKKSEKYKYSPVNEYFSKELRQYFTPKKVEFDIKELFQCDIPELDTQVILVLNGFYYSQTEPITIMENGVVFGSLRAASIRFPELFNKHYSKYAAYENDGVAALNTAFAQDGVFLHIPKNAVCEKPFQIIHLLLSDEAQMVQHRNLFILDENAEGKILICDHTLSSHEFLTNSATEIYAGENSDLDFTRVQNEHNKAIQLTNVFAHQQANSKFCSNYITLHGGKIRNNISVDLNGEGAENNSMGLYLVDNSQHVDNYININHLAPNCSSNQLYKGILDDTSSGAFNGKIYVAKDAQKTQAYQRNNNILLTDTAKMQTRPQLEIYADDVKCSHGATVGQLDTDALFYIRSRGIPYKESMHLLMYAFAHAVLSEIKLLPLRERVIELVDKRLRGELSQCDNCKMKCQ